MSESNRHLLPVNHALIIDSKGQLIDGRNRLRAIQKAYTKHGIRTEAIVLVYDTDRQRNVSRAVGAISPLSSVPEPTSLTLYGFGLAGLGFARRRKA